MTTPTSHGRSGRPWRRLRAQVLREEPWCSIRGPKCKGISTTVDHIVPLSLRPDLAHERTNLRGACTACNYRGGARMTNGRFAPPPPTPVFGGPSRDW
jgi:5-methylcytosine-specific restriction endonuclease McrA